MPGMCFVNLILQAVIEFHASVNKLAILSLLVLEER